MSTFGDTLRRWRTHRRMSQMALASEADVSPRHVSYLETGKATPSQPMVLRLAEALSVPRSARNDWLMSAGFAPIYSNRTLDSEDLAPFLAVVTRLLDRHHPYPGWALDADWRIVMSNAAGEHILSQLGISIGHSLVEAIVRDPTLGGTLINGNRAIAHLSKRLQAEGRKRNDAATLGFASRLAKQAAQFGDHADLVAVPTILRLQGIEVSLTSIQAVFNTAEDLTLADLRVELFAPSDAESERNLARLLRKTRKPG